MPNILTKLEIEELSIVDRPANPMAMAPLYKRDDSQGGNMSDKTEKMSEEMDKKIKDYMKSKGVSREEAETALMKAFDESERLKKFLIENDFVIKQDTIEKKAPVEYIEIEGEKVNKSEVPEPVLKALEKARMEKEDAEITKKAEETLPHFDQEVAKSLLKQDLDEKVLEALKAADAAFEAAMKEAGSQDAEGDMTDDAAKLEKMVEEYAKENKVTKQVAFAEVAKTKEGKQLVNKAYYKKDED